MSSENTEEKKDATLKWFWGASIAVLVIWLFNAFGFELINPSLESRAQNGDMFGPTNALFSGLAFVGLIYTIIMQRKELAMQRDELRLQREAMRDAATEQSKQAQAQLAQLAALEKSNSLTAITHDIEMAKIKLDLLHNQVRASSPTFIDKEYSAVKNKLDTIYSSLEKKHPHLSDE